MEWFGVYVLVTLVLFCEVRSFPGSDYESWINFKSKYNKQYTDVTEEIYRWTVWRDNNRLIQEHNTAADNAGETFWLAENDLTDMTAAEVEELMMGLDVDVDNLDDLHYQPGEHQSRHHQPEDSVELPESVNWSNKGYVTPVKNQGMCGSCYAFSSTGSLEGQHFRKTGKLVSISEQNIVDCSRSYGNKGCGGGTMNKAFRYIIANGGVDTEASYPYKAWEGRCRYNNTSAGATVHSYHNIPRGDEMALEAAVGRVGPVSVGMDARGFRFHFYSHGVYNPWRCSSRHLTHAVLVVGYGSTSEGQRYWVVKNSWGSRWGMEGYFRIARDRGNLCGIASMASYPIV